MNTPRRLERMSGYRQAFVEIQPQSVPNNEQPSPVEDTIYIERNIINKEEEISTFDGKEIYSYHPNVDEVIMSNKDAKSASRRAVGIDIGTGFIYSHQELSIYSTHFHSGI